MPTSVENFTPTVQGGAFSFVQNKMLLLQADPTFFGRWVVLRSPTFNFPPHVMVYASIFELPDVRGKGGICSVFRIVHVRLVFVKTVLEASTSDASVLNIQLTLKLTLVTMHLLY